jgi:hypothetical protein
MGKKEEYDILPYFRDCWKAKYYKEQVSKIKETKSENKRRELLKEFIKSKSQYMFWGRCEYEFLMASWPFGSYNFREEMKKFLKNPINLDDYTQCFNFENIIIVDMHKIDIHEQIMMNIDIIVDILFDEFKLNKK